MKTLLKIEGMTCQMCVKHVTNGLQNVSGVQSVEVDLARGAAQVEHDAVDTRQLIEAVEEEGYQAQVAAS